MTPDKATALREAAETVFSQIRLIDACGQVCVDSDSIERGVRKALEPLLAERERLRGALEWVSNAAPATQETSLAHEMANIARQALEATHD